MKHSLKTGLSFGMTSGVITTLGLMVGLHSGTHSVLAVIGGIITIAIADAFSDAVGIHMSEESENRHPAREIWESTGATFLTKLMIALSFVAPVLLLPLDFAITASVIYGVILLGLLSFYIANIEGKATFPVMAEHITIAIVVIVIAHFVGDWVRVIFGG
ncbi:MAG: hypothetical protein FJY76_03400 [Candidatus Aenigmarchaeota archaeon]|nr:hypothetical protein [Candidatus Aenigmarchaeota archaeon]